MIYLNLRLLATDRAELIEGLKMIILEVETARNIKSYVTVSTGAHPQFILDVEETVETDIEIQILNERKMEVER
jgi:hypothetical protein